LCWIGSRARVLCGQGRCYPVVFLFLVVLQRLELVAEMRSSVGISPNKAGGEGSLLLYLARSCLHGGEGLSEMEDALASGCLQGGSLSAPPLPFGCLCGEGGSRGRRRAASSYRLVLSSTPAVICSRPCLVHSPPHLQAEGRPSEKFLPAVVHEGRQSSCGLTSALSSSAWCWRWWRGGDLTPSGSVPGGEIAGFILQLFQGLDRVFQFSFRVLFAMSRDRLVNFLFFSSLDVICTVLMNIYM